MEFYGEREAIKRIENSWALKPIYFYANVDENDNIIVITDGHYSVIIGKIVSSKYSSCRSLEYRHIQIEGTNGGQYYSKYCPAKGNEICLKKCSENVETKARRARGSSWKKKNFNYGQKTKKHAITTNKS